MALFIYKRRDGKRRKRRTVGAFHHTFFMKLFI
jgi:hypothetical protein